MSLRKIYRRYRLPLVIGGVLAVGFALFVYLYWPYTGDNVPPLPPNPAYLDAELSDEERIADLMSYMTLREKIGQMALVDKGSIEDIRDVSTFGIGGVLSGGGGKPDNNTVLGWRDMVQSFAEFSRASRLGIPVLYGTDANHGHGNVPTATIFPHLIGLGATGDPALVEEVARATAEELRATGIYWSYSPTLDLPQDMRWGRVYETFSDDPTLTATLGAAYVRGLQTPIDGGRPGVLATLKHYIGVGAMRWGTSSSENFSIDQGTTDADEDALRNEYLPPFQSAVEAGALSVMVGLNSWGEEKLAASSYLIQDVLKTELGFQGFVVSDWYGVYEIPGSDYRAAVTAINAGVDMVMLPFEYEKFVGDVATAVRRGHIREERIDDAVRRILHAKFALGLFEREVATVDESVIGNSEHRKLAREAVAKSLVLLRHSPQTVPISPDADLIRVAGSAAHNVGKQAGAWTVEWQGIDGNWLPHSTSILDGIREAAPPSTRIEFDATGTFATTEIADIGIAVVGEAPYAEGWGDKAVPALSAEDIATVNSLAQVSRRVVVVLVTGRPLFITDEIDDWDALVVAWLPGSEGGGVADVLFGLTPFTGKLPVPWPERTQQLPIKADGTTADGTKTLFPRFFGLTLEP